MSLRSVSLLGISIGRSESRIVTAELPENFSILLEGWDDEDWSAEQVRLDREWYMMDEGQSEADNPFNDVAQEYIDKREQQLEARRVRLIPFYSIISVRIIFDHPWYQYATRPFQIFAKQMLNLFCSLTAKKVIGEAAAAQCRQREVGNESYADIGRCPTIGAR